MLRIVIVVATTLAGAGGALAGGDVTLGQLVFEDKCASCHTVGGGEAKRGPDLANVIDRPAGAVEGYQYSDALLEAAAAGLVWDLETLDRFITKPRKVINGSFMNFTGVSNPDDVANVIAYLATFSPPPAQ